MLVKKQTRLDVRRYSLYQKTTNEWNKGLTDSVHASSVNMFNNITNNFLKRRSTLKKSDHKKCMWTLDKPTAALSAAI